MSFCATKMASDGLKVRPNIRVEIQNNLADEEMEIDEQKSEEEEEGEIPDNHEKTVITFNDTKKLFTKSSFTTGIDIFDKQEQEKLQERAKRFQLKPNEIKNFTDEDLHMLHRSLGINVENEGNVRFEAIHVRGISEMSPEDVLDYFIKYAPNGVEWVDEESCNVVWLDKISAARALHFISKVIRGMPIRDANPFNSIEDDNESVLLINKDREIQLQEDDDNDDDDNSKMNYENSIDVTEINTTIPPGYWRLGNSHPKAKYLLLRFPFKTGKLPYKTELFARYYKNHAKLNLNGMNVDRKLKIRGIFDRNKEMNNKGPIDKNPWGILARDWDEDKEFRETIRVKDEEEQKVEIKNPSILGRLGSKRKDDDELDETKAKKAKVPRMRMYADEEEEKIKRKKFLKTIKTQLDKIEDDKPDLRNVLSSTNRKSTVQEPKVFDLGTTLRNRNKKMVFEVKVESDTRKENIKARLEKREAPVRQQRHSREKRSSRYRRHSEEFEEDYDFHKPKSKVAVVIKTHKKPTVASSVNSTVWSRIKRKSNSSSSESEIEEASSSSSSDEEEQRGFIEREELNRPGFNRKLQEEAKKTGNRMPLKIEINNDHFRN